MRGYRLLIIAVYIVIYSFGGIIFRSTPAYASYPDLPSRYDELSNSYLAGVSTQLFGFQIVDTTDNLGSIGFEFCSNSPLEDLPCTAPPVFSDSGAILSNQTGNIGFSISSASTSNDIILDRAPSPPTTGNNTYRFDNITNPDVVGSYYVRITIFSSTNGTGTPNEYGGIAFAINTELYVYSYVPPYLSFCSAITIANQDCTTAVGNSINFGTFTPATTAAATSQFSVATNANFGYSITAEGTTLTSGNNYLPLLTTPSPSTSGVSEFGMNLAANTVPPSGGNPTGSGTGVVSASYNLSNRYLYNSGDVIEGSSGSSEPQTFTVSYIANVSSQQPAGVYVTTISYICLGNF